MVRVSGDEIRLLGGERLELRLELRQLALLAEQRSVLLLALGRDRGLRRRVAPAARTVRAARASSAARVARAARREQGHLVEEICSSIPGELAAACRARRPLGMVQPRQRRRRGRKATPRVCTV